MKIKRLLVTALVACLLSTSISLAASAPASENWENHCAKCHGADGKGQTKVGKKLRLKDYSDAKVQAEMTNEDMDRVINDGVQDADGKEKMKGFAAEFSINEINALIDYIRKFKD